MPQPFHTTAAVWRKPLALLTFNFSACQSDPSKWLGAYGTPLWSKIEKIKTPCLIRSDTSDKWERTWHKYTQWRRQRDLSMNAAPSDQSKTEGGLMLWKGCFPLSLLQREGKKCLALPKQAQKVTQEVTDLVDRWYFGRPRRFRRKIGNTGRKQQKEPWSLS